MPENANPDTPTTPTPKASAPATLTPAVREPFPSAADWLKAQEEAGVGPIFEQPNVPAVTLYNQAKKAYNKGQ